MAQNQIKFKSITIAALLGIIAANEPVKANPLAIPAAAGICATGVGCVLLGTVVIGGVAYYVYNHQGHKMYVRKHEYTEEPEEHEEKSVYPLRANSWQAAQRECAFKVNYEDFKVYKKNGRWYCEKK